MCDEPTQAVKETSQSTSAYQSDTSGSQHHRDAEVDFLVENNHARCVLQSRLRKLERPLGYKGKGANHKPASHIWRTSIMWTSICTIVDRAMGRAKDLLRRQRGMLMLVDHKTDTTSCTFRHGSTRSHAPSSIHHPTQPNTNPHTHLCFCFSDAQEGCQQK